MAYLRVKPLQGHNVMAFQFFSPGLLPGQCNPLAHSARVRQVIILLDVLHQIHALFIRQNPQLCHEAPHHITLLRVTGKTGCHIQFIQHFGLAVAVNLKQLPFFFFVKFHVNFLLLKMGAKKGRPSD